MIGSRPATLTLDEARSSAAATITIKDAAAIAGVNPRTLGAALEIHGGDIPARRIGRRVVIPREAFLRWIEGDALPTATTEQVSTPAINTAAVVRAKLIELLSALDA